MRHAVSLVEILVAVAVVALIAGPILNLLSNTNKVSKASIYEVLAAQYAAELGEQLQRLSPRLREIYVKTGKTIQDLARDPALIAALGPAGTLSANGGPILTQLPGTGITMLLSPLDPAFVARQILVMPLDNPPPPNLKVLGAGAGYFWGINLGFAWRNTPRNPMIQTASYGFILREDPTPPPQGTP